MEIFGARPPHRNAGQGLVEYSLILGLSALLAVVVLLFFGGAVSTVLEFIARAVDEATRGA